MSDLADRLRELREGQRLSQMELAQRSGIHSTTISRIERRALVPSLGTLEALAHALNVSIFLGAPISPSREEDER